NIPLLPLFDSSLLSFSSHHDGQSQLSPLSNPFFQTTGRVAMRTQQRHSLVSKDTIRTTTVGDDLLVGREFRHAGLQFADRDRVGRREMSGLVLKRWTHIQ